MNNDLPIIPPRYQNRELEEMIEQKDKLLKEQAIKDAKHLAELNLPPVNKGSFLPFLTPIKAAYEELVAAVLHYLEAGSHFIKGKAEFDQSRKEERELEAQISHKQGLNENDRRDMGKYDPKVIASRRHRSYLITGIFCLAETILNANSFQIMGDNKLLAWLFSAVLSFVVCVLAHVTSLVLKECKNWRQAVLTIVVSLVIAISIFMASATLRDDYYKMLNVPVTSSVFVVYNLGIFIISVVASFFLFPSWKEIKEDRMHAKIYEGIQRREAEINELQHKLKKVTTEKILRGQYGINMPYYTKHLIRRVNKKYKDCVEKFKSTNLIYRTDRQMPPCFSEETPELDIDEVLADLDNLQNNES